MRETQKRVRRSFSDEFKQDAANLVLLQGYSFNAAADAVGVSPRSLRDWHEKLASEPKACDDRSTFAKLAAENKRLRTTFHEAEQEREILKKATTYFAKESQ